MPTVNLDFRRITGNGLDGLLTAYLESDLNLSDRIIPKDFSTTAVVLDGEGSMPLLATQVYGVYYRFSLKVEDKTVWTGRAMVPATPETLELSQLVGTTNITPDTFDASVAAVSEAILNDPRIEGIIQDSVTGFSPIGHGHTPTDITGLSTLLAGKAEAVHNHDSLYSPVGHSHTGYALTTHDHTGTYSPVGHTHDGVYSPVGHDHNGVYSPVGHVHTIGNVTGLQVALDGKAPSVHSHTTANLTDFSEAVDDEVNSLLVVGPGLAKNYDDGNNLLTLDVSSRLGEIVAGFTGATAGSVLRKNQAGTAIEFARPSTEMIAFTAIGATITGVTGETLITSLLIPAGTLSDNLRLLFQASIDATLNADVKGVRIRFGPLGTELTASSMGAGNISSPNVSQEIFRPAYSSGGNIRTYASLTPNTSPASLVSGGINYAVDNYLWITGTPVNTSNSMTCRAASVIIWR